MELCEMCQQIDILEWVEQDLKETNGWMAAGSIEHHESYMDLCQSASQGCRLCILLRHALLDSMHDYAVKGYAGCDWQPSTVETYLLNQRNFSQERFFIEPQYFKPGDGGGFVADTPLLRGFYYMKTSLEYSPLYMGPLLSFKASHGNSQAQIAGRSNGLRPDLNVAKEWMHCCISQHVECAQQKDSSLPTRLIDCGSDWSTQTVRIVENVGSGPYIALSHCWGSIQPLRTTKQNYGNHLTGISFADLPASFQDAVVTARSFGVRYVWIDSLCIIQDSTEDWEQECSKMAEVYANALLTIAASDAPNCTSGFLGDYAQYNATTRTTLRFRNRDEGLSDDLIVEYASPSVQDITDGDSHLASRGWALQERLLSPRTISFHNDRLRWECNRYSRSDDLCHPFKTNRIVYDLVEKRDIRRLNDAEEIFNHWYNIIDTYSSCKLTESMDKLPAISGLAREFSNILGNPYLAGLWRDDLHVGLSWYTLRGSDEELDGDKERATEVRYRAPSWSWASCDSELGFRSDSRRHKKDLVLISGGTVLRGTDHFGQVTSGSLHVNGRLEQCMVRKVSGEFLIFESNTLSKGQSPLARLYLDSPRMRERLRGCSLEEIDVMALLISSDAHGHNKWISLALVQGLDNSRAFQRIGLIVCHGCYEAGFDWFNDVQRQCLVII